MVGTEWWGQSGGDSHLIIRARVCEAKGKGEPLYQVYQPHHYKASSQLRISQSQPCIPQPQPYISQPQLHTAKPQLYAPKP